VRVEPLAIPQPYEGIVILGIGYENRTLLVAVDYYDYPFVNNDCLGRVALYFKMQHRRSGYGDPRIQPGGYVAASRSVYDYYCRLRKLRDRTPKFDVYGRFGMGAAADVRRRAIQILEDETRFRFVGGASVAYYMQFLREAASARVCIDMPGNGPFCYRLVEYLAAGCCIVSPRHGAVMQAELIDGKHIAYCRADLADLADRCAYYVEDSGAREEMERNAASFFDAHLHPTRLAEHYLRAVSDHIGA
jgi:glycosyltransferase involved in cell wall biosynthesis